MNINNQLVLVGGGGHCKSVIDVAECAGYSILGVLDKPEEVGKTVLGYPVIGTDDDMEKYVDLAAFVVTIGQIKSPDLRIRLHRMIITAGGHLATVISPTAQVSKYASIGEGTVIMHQAVVNAGASIGIGCIVNTFANIEHDVEVGDFCHVSTGAMINGCCKVGDRCFLGSQSVLVHGITLCDEVLVGAGSVVRKSLLKKGIYVGNPSTLINTK